VQLAEPYRTMLGHLRHGARTTCTRSSCPRRCWRSWRSCTTWFRCRARSCSRRSRG
jgi:hypothetical protein